MKKKLNFWFIPTIIIIVTATIIIFNASADQNFPAYFYIHGRDEDFYAWSTQIAEMTDPVARSTEQANYEERSHLATYDFGLSMTRQALGCFEDLQAPGCMELIPRVIYGIQDDMGQGRLPSNMRPVNGWIGKVNGEGMAVRVGYYTEDPLQGFVSVQTEISGKTFLLFLPSPQKIGALRIEEVVGNRLVLSATGSDQPLFFDVLALNFVDDLTSIVPTAPPRPTYPPQPDTGPTPSPNMSAYPFETPENRGIPYP